MSVGISGPNKKPRTAGRPRGRWRRSGGCDRAIAREQYRTDFFPTALQYSRGGVTL